MQNQNQISQFLLSFLNLNSNNIANSAFEKRFHKQMSQMVTHHVELSQLYLKNISLIMWFMLLFFSKLFMTWCNTVIVGKIFVSGSESQCSYRMNYYDVSIFHSLLIYLGYARSGDGGQLMRNRGYEGHTNLHIRKLKKKKQLLSK